MSHKTPANFEGPEDCEATMLSLSADKPSGSKFGSIVHYAREGGYRGSANLSSTEAAATAFANVKTDSRPTVDASLIEFSSVNLAKVDRRPWNIPGVQPAQGIGVTAASPNQGKTFGEIYRLGQLAAGSEWFGHKCKQGATILFALEGQIDNRIVAYRQHYEPNADAPFVFKHGFMDLKQRKAAEMVVKSALAYAKRQGVDLRCISFDTLQAALGGGSDTDPKDVGPLLENASFIARETGCFVNFLHHRAKKSSGSKEGSRGWGGILGAVDVEEIIEDGRIFNSKQRDAVKALPLMFKIVSVPLGNDLDGNPITSGVLVPTLSVGRAQEEADLKPGTDAAHLFDLIVAATGVNAGGLVFAEEVRTRFSELHGDGRSLATMRQARKRALETLVDGGRVEMRPGGKLKIVVAEDV